MATVSVLQRFRSCFYHAKFVPKDARATIAAAIFPIVFAEIIFYSHLQLSIKQGELPWYITDVVIMALAGVEALTATLFSWLGYKRRRTVILAATMIPATMIFLLYAMPDIDTAVGSNLCRGAGNWSAAGITSPAILRLTIVLILAVAFAFARNAILAHGIGYMAEHSVEGMSLTIGVFLLVRVVGLQLLSRSIDSSTPFWLQVGGVTGPMVFSIVQLLRFPSMPPLADGETSVSSDGRGFFSSLRRVINNKFVMSQIFAAAFIGVALWGFAYHQIDVAKAKYFSFSASNFQDEFADTLRLYIVFFAVLVFGSRYGAPAMPVFRRAAAAKLATTLTAMAIIVYQIITAALGCDVGQIAGLTEKNYIQPECSSQCGCTSALNVLSPICLVDQMTSYVSPCHAGCYNDETVGGVTILSNCTCGVGRAMPGICSQSLCRDSHELHKLMFIIIMLCSSDCKFDEGLFGTRHPQPEYELHKLLFSIIIMRSIVAMQKQMTLMVRASDPRDRSVAVGVACTVIALVVFIFGHGIFFLIRALTCSWIEDGVCRLQSSAFPYIIGGTCGGFALLSFSISLFTCLKLRRRKDPIDYTVDE